MEHGDDESDDDEEDEDLRRYGHQEAMEKLGLTISQASIHTGRQRNYLRYHVFMMDMSLADFKAELRRQNNFLKYFPVPDDRRNV
jgi:hypothetical protein